MPAKRATKDLANLPPPIEKQIHNDKKFAPLQPEPLEENKAIIDTTKEKEGHQEHRKEQSQILKNKTNPKPWKVDDNNHSNTTDNIETTTKLNNPTQAQNEHMEVEMEKGEAILMEIEASKNARKAVASPSIAKVIGQESQKNMTLGR